MKYIFKNQAMNENNPKWIIGNQEIIEMPFGEYKVFVELLFKEINEQMTEPTLK